MNNLLLSDAHAHIGSDEKLQERRDNEIVSLLCATNPAEAETLLHHCSNQTLIPTCGLHPWHADQYSLADMMTYLESVPVIGEIGMDSVWCSVPLDIQKDLFCQQLTIACEMKKPVILHTKGQEKEIAAIISRYPNRYLVHWYSCENYLDEYLALDCYFSIGPDVWWNPAVQNVATKVPLNRLLIETDGLGAVKWAWDEAPVKVQHKPEITLSGSLLHTLKTVAELRNLSLEKAAQITHDNLISEFLAK